MRGLHDCGSVGKHNPRLGAAGSGEEVISGNSIPPPAPPNLAEYPEWEGTGQGAVPVCWC